MDIYYVLFKSVKVGKTICLKDGNSEHKINMSWADPGYAFFKKANWKKVGIFICTQHILI